MHEAASEAELAAWMMPLAAISISALLISLGPSVAPIGLVVLLFAGTTWHGRRHPWLALPLFVGLGVRLAFAAVHAFGFELPDANGDAAVFDALAWSFATGSIREGPPLGGSEFYGWLASWLYEIVGHSPLTLQVVNVGAGALAIPLAGNIARRAWHQSPRGKPVQWVLWAMALFPTLVLYSAIIMREAILIALTLGAILLTLRGLQDRRISELLIATMVVAATVALHGGYAPLILMPLAAILAMISVSRNSQPEAFRRQAVVAAIITGIIATAAFSGRLFSKIPNITEKGWAAFVEAQAARTRGRTAYPDWLILDNLWGIILLLPVKAAWFLFSPFPWMIREPMDLLGAIDAAAILLLVIMAALAARSSRQHRGTWVVVLGLILTGMLFVLGTNNYGTAARHRAKLVPMLIIMGAGFIAEWQASRRGVAPQFESESASPTPPGSSLGSS